MKPEEKARQNIDKLLEAAGWTTQDFKDLNLGASLGVAVREFLLISSFCRLHGHSKDSFFPEMNLWL